MSDATKIFVSKTDDERRCAIAGEDDVLGIVGRQNAQGICALDDRQRAADGTDQITVAKLLFEQMGEHLGVGLARERVALADQIRAERREVLDDPVVDHGDPARAVHVRVSVRVGRPSMRGPARVPDPDRAVQWVARQRFLEVAELPDPLAADDFTIVDERHACRVVTPIFQASQAVEKNSDHVAIADVPHDAAHLNRSRLSSEAVRPSIVRPSIRRAVVRARSQARRSR